jgi:proline dehydrogenase
MLRRHGMRLGASRWVAGETVAEIDGMLRRLTAQGPGAATALFDASVASQAQAEAQVREYHAAIRHLATAELDTYVGIKLSHLGLGFDDPDSAVQNTAAIVRDRPPTDSSSASRWNSHTTSRTPRDPPQLRQTRLDNCGLVTQSYLCRSEADLEQRLQFAPTVRLVKGAYVEPPQRSPIRTSATPTPPTRDSRDRASQRTLHRHRHPRRQAHLARDRARQGAVPTA